LKYYWDDINKETQILLSTVVYQKAVVWSKKGSFCAVEIATFLHCFSGMHLNWKNLLPAYRAAILIGYLFAFLFITSFKVFS
jgi:hypothetical protein